MPNSVTLIMSSGLRPKRSPIGPARDVARGNPIRLLFGEGFALQTTLLWIIFFCSLMDIFLFVFWLPEILHLIGMTPAQSVFASSLYALGGIVAVLYLGWA